MRREIDVRPQGVVDTREASAERRAYEYRLEEMLRRQIQAAMASEVASLRSEVSALRSDFIEKVGGQLRLERIETTRLIGSNLEALQHEVRQVASAHTTLDAESYSVPVASYHDGYAEPGYPPALESAPPAQAQAQAQHADPWLTARPTRFGDARTADVPPAAAPPPFESPAAVSPPWEASPAPYQQPPAFQPHLVLFDQPAASFEEPSLQSSTPLFEAPSVTPASEPAWQQSGDTQSWQPEPSVTPPGESSAGPFQPSTPLFESPLGSAAPLFEPSNPLFDASTPLFDAASAASTPLFESFLNTPTPPEPKPQPAAPADPFADMPRLTRFTDPDADAGPSANRNANHAANGRNGSRGIPPEPSNGRPAPVNGIGAPPSTGGRRRRDADDANDTLSQIFQREGVARS